jgi:NDP-sugar pyrophosphorylase family protein
MQALILAGGKGTRLRPYTAVLPKPLMPIGEMPILAVILRQLKVAGFTEVILAVNYLSHLFEAILGSGDLFGLRVHYSSEEKELGTAGPIAMAWPHLEDDFLVMNGDILTTLDYAGLYRSHVHSGAKATIAVYQRDVHIDFGVVHSTPDGRLVRYEEKPTLHYQVSMGVNMLNKKGIEPHLRFGEHMDLPDLMTAMSTAGEHVGCYQANGYWLDIGRIDDYMRANEEFEPMRHLFLPET